MILTRKSPMPKSNGRPRQVKIPANARIVLQTYDPAMRTYRQLPGYSLSRIEIASRPEFERLWLQLKELAADRGWSDRARARSEAAADAREG